MFKGTKFRLANVPDNQDGRAIRWFVVMCNISFSSSLIGVGFDESVECAGAGLDSAAAMPTVFQRHTVNY